MTKKELTENEALVKDTTSEEKTAAELSKEPQEQPENTENVEEKADTRKDEERADTGKDEERAGEESEAKETRETRETSMTRETSETRETSMTSETNMTRGTRITSEPAEPIKEAGEAYEAAKAPKAALPETGDEALDSALRLLAQDIRDGRWSEHSLQLLRHGLNHDIDVAKARHEGEVAGRNLRINEYLIEKREPAGIHNLTGGGSTLARTVPAERLGGLAAAEKPSIWQRGNEKRIVR